MLIEERPVRRLPAGRSVSRSTPITNIPSMRQLRTPPLFRLHIAILVAAVTAFSGCYTQHPLTATVPALGTDVVALLTDSGTVAMGNQLGPGVTEVEGVVAEADGNSWRLLMTRVDQRGGTSTLWNREPVTFPRYALTGVTVRRLDKKRSWIVAGAITAAALIAARAFGAFDITSEGGSDTGAAK
jgi:hypothetical protein